MSTLRTKRCALHKHNNDGPGSKRSGRFGISDDNIAVYVDGYSSETEGIRYIVIRRCRMSYRLSTVPVFVESLDAIG